MLTYMKRLFLALKTLTDFLRGLSSVALHGKTEQQNINGSSRIKIAPSTFCLGLGTIDRGEL